MLAVVSPSLGVDGVGAEVRTESVGCGLWQEVEDGLPLFNELERRGTLQAEPFDHPGVVKHTEESSGTTRASRPERLQGGRVRGVVCEAQSYVHVHTNKLSSLFVCNL